MNFIKGMIAGFVLVGLTAFGMGACTKQVDPIVAQPAVQAVVETPATPAPVVVETKTTTTETVKVDKPAPKVDKVVVKSKHKRHVDSPETAATAKAEMNAMRARCLRFAVDFKIDQDIRNGKITDWGNILVEGPCEKYKTSGNREPRGKGSKPSVAGGWL